MCVHVCVCLCVPLCLCVYLCSGVCVRVCAFVCVSVCVRECVCVLMCRCTCVCKNAVGAFVPKSVCLFVCCVCTSADLPTLGSEDDLCEMVKAFGRMKDVLEQHIISLMHKLAGKQGKTLEKQDKNKDVASKKRAACNIFE